MPYKIDCAALKNINVSDRHALWAIAAHRCLTAEQMAKYIYKNAGYSKKSIGKLVQRGFIRPVSYGEDDTAYFLTAKGTASLKTFESIAEKSEDEAVNTSRQRDDNVDNGLRYPYGIRPETFPLRPHELMMRADKIPHQIQLNEFALSFYAAMQARGLDADRYMYMFVDETYIPTEFRREGCIRRDDSRQARPDAMLLFPNQDMCFLIENDMCSETQKQLKQKWQRYLSLLMFGQDYFKGMSASGDMAKYCLFSLAECPNTRRRKNTVVSSLGGVTQFPNPDCDVIVEPPDKLLEFIFDTLSGRKTAAAGLIESLRSQGAKPVRLPQKTYYDDFEAVFEFGGELRLIDSYDCTSGYVLKKATEFGHIKSILAAEYQSIRYTIVARDVAMLRHDLARLGGAAKDVEIVAAEDAVQIDVPESVAEIKPEIVAVLDVDMDAPIV